MTPKSIEHLTAALAIIGCTATTLAADSTVPTDFATIQAAIDDTGTVDGDTITVLPGTYVENVTIDKELTLVSSGGRAVTTIEGISFLGSLGTIVVPTGVDNVRIEGFTIKGIDNGLPGIENAAVYFQGTPNGDIIDNEIIAIGDHGLLTEYNAVILDFLIDGNIFSGSTFFDPPAGDGFSMQFTLPNVPRQLVVMGGGSGGTNGDTVVFTNNQVTGTAGGFDPAGDPQGNNLVTIDVDNSTITGNSFTGTTSRFATSFRARRPNELISGNTFTRTGLLPFAGYIFRQNGDVTLGALAAANTFDGPLFFSPGPGDLNGTIFPISGLSLEIPDCPDDADAASGYQIAVEVWMRGLTSPATGFQAFIEFDDVVLDYRGDLSSYTGAPFPLHIQPILTANVGTGEIRIDGSDALGDPGETADSLLATLVFDVDVECSNIAVLFDLDEGFDSELSFEGDPIPTLLENTQAFVVDDTPPVFDAYSDITVSADAGVGNGCVVGTVVNYTLPTASDGCGGTPVVACVMPPGSTFPVATTQVDCTATDDCGNVANFDFDITVTATNLIDIVVELPGTVPASRCIHFVTDACSNTLDETLVFTGTTPTAVATIEIGCGDWSILCAKDEQHTQWDTSTLSLSGDSTRWIADFVLVLIPGDNDNDGDVDINDITLIVSQFGGPEPSGGCPWDGSRGADLNNNGNVGSEDWSLIGSQWLTISGCACTPAPFETTATSLVRSISTTTLDADIARRVDLNRDGRFDVKDVVIFETLNGLPPAVSSLMADTARTDLGR